MYVAHPFKEVSNDYVAHYHEWPTTSAEHETFSDDESIQQVFLCLHSEQYTACHKKQSSSSDGLSLLTLFCSPLL